MKFVRLAALGAAMLALGIAVISCGDDDDDDANGVGDEPLPTATRGTAASPTAGAVETQPSGGATVTVTAADFSFSPAKFAVSGASDTEIEVTNGGSAPHTLTIYRDQEFSDAVNGATTDRLSGGDTESFTLASSDIAGATQLFFRCEVHPSQMQGEITVE